MKIDEIVGWTHKFNLDHPVEYSHCRPGCLEIIRHVVNGRMFRLERHSLGWLAYCGDTCLVDCFSDRSCAFDLAVKKVIYGR